MYDKLSGVKKQTMVIGLLSKTILDNTEGKTVYSENYYRSIVYGISKFKTKVTPDTVSRIVEDAKKVWRSANESGKIKFGDNSPDRLLSMLGWLVDTTSFKSAFTVPPYQIKVSNTELMDKYDEVLNMLDTMVELYDVSRPVSIIKPKVKKVRDKPKPKSVPVKTVTTELDAGKTKPELSDALSFMDKVKAKTSKSRAAVDELKEIYKDNQELGVREIIRRRDEYMSSMMLSSFLNLATLSDLSYLLKEFKDGVMDIRVLEVLDTGADDMENRVDMLNEHGHNIVIGE